MNQEQTVKSTRSSMQIGRRLFHIAMGVMVATVYRYFVTKDHGIYLLGGAVSIWYLIEQIRIKYPEFADRFVWLTKYVMRAEERLNESAIMPYIIALLLTIITFPKNIAIAGILTLALADPMSALFGIKFGKHKLGPGKTLEGSLAFLSATIAIMLYTFLPLSLPERNIHTIIAIISASILITLFELIPVRIDDNLTIPLFTSSITWIIFSIFEISY